MKTKEFPDRDFPIVYMYDGTVPYSLILFLKHLYQTGRGKDSALKVLFLTVGEMYKFYYRTKDKHDKWNSIPGTFILDYFSSRMHGTIDGQTLRCDRGLYWQPLKRNRLMVRLSAYEKYESFCKTYLGVENMVHDDLIYNATSVYSQLKAKEGKSLLHHLLDPERVRNSRDLNSFSVVHAHERHKPGAKTYKYFPPQKIVDFINSQSDVNYRAAMLLMAFTGLRYSEVCHILISDIVPGVGGLDVILDHPNGLTWDHKNKARVKRESILNNSGKVISKTSDLDDSDLDFLTHLRTRSSLPKDHKYYSGWKGVTFHTSDHKYGYILSWSSDKAKGEFIKLFKKLIHQPRRAGHPFLLCKNNGAPMTLDALEQKVRRDSNKITGKSYGPHSLRHFCGYYLANKLGVSMEHAQFFLRHANISSTEVYYMKSSASVKKELLGVLGNLSYDQAKKLDKEWDNIW